MGSERRKRDRRPARRAASRSPRRRLLVVCEGEQTEPDYIRGYERIVRNATVEIEIPRERGDPRKLVEIAKDRKRAAEADARRHDDPFFAFDEVWCVFDRDDHERYDEACAMARDNGFQLAISNPCVELWLLLHLRESPGMRHRHDLRRMLRQHLPGYETRVDFEQVAHGIGAATQRARHLDSDAEAMGEAGRNPTTGFYLLTEAIARKDP